MADLLERLAFVQAWVQHGTPAVYWISGFFFPQVSLAAADVQENCLLEHADSRSHTKLASCVSLQLIGVFRADVQQHACLLFLVVHAGLQLKHIRTACTLVLCACRRS
jgi:hypothetical protein